MANEGQTFSYRLIKISLIILNSLVIVGMTFSLLLIGHHFETSVVIFVLLIESNFLVAILGAIRESRPLVVTTGSVTLILLMMAVFNGKERTQNSTFSFLYFLAIVMLSYAYSAMLKERQQNHWTLSGHRSQTLPYSTNTTGQSNQTDANSVPFTTVVVYHSANPTANPSQVMPTGAPGELPNDAFKDLPPPYEDCPPPKYEEVANSQQK